MLITLPGLPDGLARAENGDFLIAFYSKRRDSSTLFNVFLKLRISCLIFRKASSPQPAPYGFIAVMNEEAEFVDSLHDTKGKLADAVTSVEEINGVYYFGTLKGDFVGKLEK